MALVRPYNANNFVWHDKGACNKMDPSFFVPEGVEALNRAKSFCHTSGCTVREQCLAFALHTQEHGVWGGTSPGDRKRMRRQLGVSLRKTA